MDIKAEAKHIRMSPRKVRLVVDAIKSFSPQEAIEKLMFVNKRAAKPVVKVIQSAIANAKNNFKLDETSLKFKEIQVNEGPTLKRSRAISRGRSHQIMKRTSHIKVILKTKKKKQKTKNTKARERGS